MKKFKTFHKTWRGRRKENQDNCWSKTFKSRQFVHAIAVVCDGMGGQKGGKLASKIAIKNVKNYIKNPPNDRNEIKLWLTNLLSNLRQEMEDEAKKDMSLQEMGTTMTLSLMTENHIHIFHIGDSKAYNIENDKIWQITSDHTALQESIESGDISEDTTCNSSYASQYASALTRYLSPGMNFEPDSICVELSNSNVVFICSDGLTGTMLERWVTDYEIYKECTSKSGISKRSIANLMQLALDNGSTDNLSIAIIEHKAC